MVNRSIDSNPLGINGAAAPIVPEVRPNWRCFADGRVVS